MKKIALFVGILIFGWMFQAQAQDAQSIVVRDFGSMMRAWSSRNYAMLWEYGTDTSKSVWSKNDFMQRMSRTRPLSSDNVVITRINMTYPTLAYVRAQITFLDNLLNERVETRQFQLVYENGFFRAGLGDFLR